MSSEIHDPDSPAARPDWIERTAEALWECVVVGRISEAMASNALALLGMIEADRLMAPVPSIVAGALTFVWPAHDRLLSAEVLGRSRLRLGIEAGGKVLVRGECGPLVLRRELAKLYPYLRSRWGGGSA